MKVYAVVYDEGIYAMFKDKEKAEKYQEELYEAYIKKYRYLPVKYIMIEEYEVIE